jgi:hypothetical protein
MIQQEYVIQWRPKETYNYLISYKYKIKRGRRWEQSACVAFLKLDVKALQIWLKQANMSRANASKEINASITREVHWYIGRCSDI